MSLRQTYWYSRILTSGLPPTCQFNLPCAMNVQPPFAVLQQLCAWAGKSDQVGVIHKVQKLIQKIYPDEYHQHLGFKYYHASALCYAGDVREGLEELTQLYSSQPQGQKKIKDTVTFIIYHIINSNNEDHEKLVFNFVNNLAVGQGQLSPALSLWCACFSSSLYRLQVMSEVLLERHPGLIRMLERKLDNMVRRAAWDGDDELLHRILQLTLHYKLSKKISSVTSDIGDLHGADETIKFAQRVGVRLTPSTVQRFLALLNHHRRPAPLYLLALKYGPSPPKTSVPKPPKFKYKF
ncbi:hypothetical protein Hamer_G010237 [Homarus americanus]|uniref:Uncharacterized protein n=1 Tax=Homarus americanus TaxID=6706 RepID=A0A8J5K758_HOMAM|nr:hypothetical protein Hamer_G010237 [Homarus americanus]